MNASEKELSSLVGIKVRATREFSGIPEGTIGTVVEHYRFSRDHEGVMVEWTTVGGHKVKDGFGRDKEFDETQWLAIV